MDTFRYSDLVDSNGNINHAAYDTILAANIKAEIDLDICVRADRSCPSDVVFGEVRAWRAEEAAQSGLTVSPETRAEIERQERRNLDDIVAMLRSSKAEAARQIEAEDRAA